MKYLDSQAIEKRTEKRIYPHTRFQFKCSPDVSCFNQCCRNLNLFLYPYDIIRLKNNLRVSSDQFIDQYTDIVMREGSYFPDVLLTMADNAEKTCPFLTETGCQVYPDRPDACRTFPIEMGMQYFAQTRTYESVYFFRPPEFCKGSEAGTSWTIDTWVQDQSAGPYHRMTIQWSKVKMLFQNNPWGPDGFNGQAGKMAFMAAYNMDHFRDFVLNSSFLKRYKVKKDGLNKIKKQDESLLKLAFEWIKLFVWQMPSKMIKPKL